MVLAKSIVLQVEWSDFTRHYRSILFNSLTDRCVNEGLILSIDKVAETTQLLPLIVL